MNFRANNRVNNDTGLKSLAGARGDSEVRYAYDAEGVNFGIGTLAVSSDSDMVLQPHTDCDTLDVVVDCD